MKTAYKFESKHLGQAFMKELEEMGYNQDECLCGIENATGIRIESACRFSKSFCGIDKAFQLESQWNEALEHAREQLKPEFKKGDWVTWGEQSCVRIEEFYKLNANKGFMGSGSSGVGAWKYDHIFGSFDLRKATPEEVEQALIKEAERRGFPCDVWYHPTKYNVDFVSDPDNYDLREWEYDSVCDELSYLNGVVYAKGDWAKPDTNKFFDWDVKKVGGRVHIGCADYTTSFLSGLKSALRHVKDKTVQEVLDELDKI